MVRFLSGRINGTLTLLQLGWCFLGESVATKEFISTCNWITKTYYFEIALFRTSSAICYVRMWRESMLLSTRQLIFELFLRSNLTDLSFWQKKMWKTENWIGTLQWVHFRLIKTISLLRELRVNNLEGWGLVLHRL
jgi:hypothetical protein